MPWNEVFQRLSEYARQHPCKPPSPPVPLILNGWIYSNDTDKLDRWGETVAWAVNNGCSELISDIPDRDFYFVERPTTYRIGAMGGPMYREWDSETKERPGAEKLVQYLDTLRSRWVDIVGKEIAAMTQPISFTGEKARRLVVLAESAAEPPWGEWVRLAANEAERRTFTGFRAAINRAIAPHEVDHIDFITEPAPNPATAGSEE
jgi:hypothetical protein